ncbi:hypothetical protein EDD11_002518 [Mortierella claussenii]|nr:hypothetical protein EDD11_002518 [Mortierella claussenii]
MLPCVEPRLDSLTNTGISAALGAAAMEPAAHYKGMLASLLKDRTTVNVEFSFDTHRCGQRVRVGAHRVILERYRGFYELFQMPPYKDNSTRNNDDDNTVINELATAVVPLEGVSPMAFCVLLKFVYTGDLDLSFDANQFVVRSMDQPCSPPIASAMSNATLFYAQWNTKVSVIWGELLMAADRFKVVDMRQRCLNNLLALLDKGNAMEIFFHVGVLFKDEIGDPVKKYILTHLEDGL